MTDLRMNRSYDEFQGKTFRECAEIIVGDPKDKEWTDKQIEALVEQHTRKLKEAVAQTALSIFTEFKLEMVKQRLSPTPPEGARFRTPEEVLVLLAKPYTDELLKEVK